MESNMNANPEYPLQDRINRVAEGVLMLGATLTGPLAVVGTRLLLPEIIVLSGLSGFQMECPGLHRPIFCNLAPK
jgi:hypothetical protein